MAQVDRPIRRLQWPDSLTGVTGQNGPGSEQMPRRRVRVEALEGRDLPSAAPFDVLHDDIRLPDLSLIAAGPFPAGGSGGLQPMGGAGGGPAGPLQPPDVAFSYSTNGAGLPLLTGFAGAPVTIFLDFDGDANNAAMDLDGNPATFNAAEQARIVECWRQVSVYFAPFDVNVTTIQPNPQSTPTAWMLIGNSIDNGWAYVNSFPSSGATGFANSYFAHDRASGVAHELGHIFGAWHQSDYDTLGNKVNEYSSGYDALHAPIMGVDFAGSVRKWFVGHGSLAADTLQDDLAIIANRVKAYQSPGGDGYRADATGGTTAAATAMTTAGPNQCAWEVIERPGDVDAFSFSSTGGVYSIAAVPNYPSGLDARFEVYSSAGTLLAAADAGSNDQSVTLDLPAGTYFMLVAGHGDYGDIGAYYVHARPMPAGWDSRNVGTVFDGGYAGFDPTTASFRIGGSGGDIWGTADSFRYTSTTLSGNGSITARVVSQEATAGWSKVGVMIRESLATGSRHALMAVTPGNGVAFQWRATTNAGSGNANTAGPVAPYWVRLTRTGNTLTGFASANGTTWTQIGTATVAMTSVVQIGLAVCSGNANQANPLADAVFDNVSLTGATGPQPPIFNGLPAPGNFVAALAAGAGVALSWDPVAGANGYAIDRSADNVTWSPAGTTAGTSFTDAPPGSQRWFYRASALDANGRSIPAPTQSLVSRPVAPVIVRIMSVRADRLVVDWRDVAGDTGYRVERSSDGGVNWTIIASVGTNVPSYADSGLTAYTQYTYRITALSPQGDGPASAAASRFTRLPALTGLQFTTVASNQLALQWNAVPNATAYRVERSTDGNTFTIVTTTTLTAYSDSNVVPLGEYYYRVAGVNAQTETEGTARIFRAAPATTGLPTPWTAVDVGAVGGAGATGETAGVFTTVASGTDIWGSQDQFRFISRPLVGDGTITARVVSQDNTATWSKVGVMIRESAAANSRHAMIVVTPGAGVAFQWRSTNGGGSFNVNSTGVAAPYWVRLRRTGTTFSGYASPDGVAWTLISSTNIAMAANTIVGLAACAGNNALLTTARFDNVQLATGAPRVASVTVNSGAAQRSRVTAVQVAFNQRVAFVGLPAAAFQLRRQSDNAAVAMSAAVDDSGPATVATLTFTGALSTAGSLDDGRYTLTVLAAQVANADGNLDGNADGTGGDDYLLVGDLANRLFRLFGDHDGDGDVDAGDFGAFRGDFGGTGSTFDFDNDGDVDASDFGQFRGRFGAGI